MRGDKVAGADPQPGQVRVELGDALRRGGKLPVQGNGLFQRRDRAVVVPGDLVELSAERQGPGGTPDLPYVTEGGERCVAVMRRLLDAAEAVHDHRALEPGHGTGPGV